MTRFNIIALAAALSAAAFPAFGAAGIDHNQELQACVRLAEAKPAEAMESALAWQDRGGGDLARLCQALALFHRGDFKAAGARLEELAPLLGRNDPKGEAGILARAGWAYLRAGDAGHADRLYTAALDRQPDDVDLHIDRAFARAEAERYWDAVADLDTAIRNAPARADAYLYRAGAYKALSNLRQAAADVSRALELRPGDPEAVLLRGNVKAAAGDTAGAADDWRTVTRIAADTTAAKAARTNLDRLAKINAAAAREGAGKAEAPPARPDEKKPEPAKRP